MPTYHYICKHGHITEKVMTIREMEFHDSRLNAYRCVAKHEGRRCNCQMRRHFAPKRHVTFHEGFYEHTTEDGVYCSSMQELRSAAREAGNYSVYAEDMGSLFRAKDNRWV